VTGSVPTKNAVGSSPIGSLSRIVAGRVEIVDLEERRVDLFLLEERAQTIVAVGLDDRIGLIRLGGDDRDGVVAGLADRTSLFGIEGHHGSPRLQDCTRTPGSESVTAANDRRGITGGAGSADGPPKFRSRRELRPPTVGHPGARCSDRPGRIRH
jgi:hypothetical protein